MALRSRRPGFPAFSASFRRVLARQKLPIGLQACQLQLPAWSQLRFLPAFDLPRAEAFIDRLFILVLACSDMNASLDWLEKHVGLEVGRRRMEIVYTMLARAFDLPEEDLHVISTMVHDRDVFLELDQMPDIATPRPGRPDTLPQGVAIGTFRHPDFDAVDAKCRKQWITPPAVRKGAVYGDKRAGTVRAPDGTLVEIVEA